MKKNLFITALVFEFLLFTAQSCKDRSDCHGGITIQNNSSKAIYVDAAAGYPDTTYFKYGPNPAGNAYDKKVEAGQGNTAGVNSFGNCMESFLTKPIMIYIFDAHVLETTPWDTVIAHNLYLKRYDLTLADIKNRNWLVTYP